MLNAKVDYGESVVHHILEVDRKYDAGWWYLLGIINTRKKSSWKLTEAGTRITITIKFTSRIIIWHDGLSEYDFDRPEGSPCFVHLEVMEVQAGNELGSLTEIFESRNQLNFLNRKSINRLFANSLNFRRSNCVC